MPSNYFFPIACLFLLSNLLVIQLMFLDKRSAKTHGWRIPEASFFLLAILGGTPALIAMMHHLRHKTAKSSFKWRVYIILAVQLLAIPAIWLIRG